MKPNRNTVINQVLLSTNHTPVLQEPKAHRELQPSGMATKRIMDVVISDAAIS